MMLFLNVLSIIIFCKGKSIVEAAEIYKSVGLNSGMDNKSLAIYTDYFFSTFMQHYKLYQLVFQSERKLNRYTTTMVVEPPLPPTSLKHGKIPALHEYDQRLKEIQASQQEVIEIEPVENLSVEIEDLKGCSQTEV